MGNSSGIHNTILDVIGQTPIVKLHRLSRDLRCEVYAKLENLNPGGSHKVRIALAMIQDAEKRGVLRRGSGQVILEPSGGNTGIGLAMVGALYGYRVILVIPDNYSPEKQAVLRLYGAEIILSDSKRGNNSHGEMAMEILPKDRPSGHDISKQQLSWRNGDGDPARESALRHAQPAA